MGEGIIKEAINAVEAQKIVEREKQERIDRCGKAIQEVLVKENCFLDVSMVITQQGNIPQMRITAK